MPADTYPELRAEHRYGAIGGMLPLRDMTQITTAKGEFIAQEAGHLPDGSLWIDGRKTHRLRLVGAQARKAA